MEAMKSSTGVMEKANADINMTQISSMIKEF
jgi:hypothetical protein